MKQSRTAFQLGLLLVIVVPLALFARWQWGNREWGANFLPHPDSLEYAAALLSAGQRTDRANAVISAVLDHQDLDKDVSFWLKAIFNSRRRPL